MILWLDGGIKKYISKMKVAFTSLGLAAARTESLVQSVSVFLRGFSHRPTALAKTGNIASLRPSRRKVAVGGATFSMKPARGV